MPYYCTVPRCTSMAGKAKNVSFHQFPRDEELAKLWNRILKRGKPYTKYSKVCSLHFKPEDYTITSVGKNKGQWRTLRKDAVPSQNLPSESPTPYARRSPGCWAPAQPSLDPLVQQQMAQAIYMQTMLAMQSATAAETHAAHDQPLQMPEPIKPSPSGSSLSEIELLLRRDTDTAPKDVTYKCQECSKCFKDPDVFLLHKRTHKNTNNIEKENYSTNIQDREETLRANPILANLLKSTMRLEPESSISNILSVENQIMTALASNMEAYIRTLTSMLSNQTNTETESDKCEERSDDESDCEEETNEGDGESKVCEENEDMCVDTNDTSIEKRDDGLDYEEEIKCEENEDMCLDKNEMSMNENENINETKVDSEDISKRIVENMTCDSQNDTTNEKQDISDAKNVDEDCTMTNALFDKPLLEDQFSNDCEGINENAKSNESENEINHENYKSDLTDNHQNDTHKTDNHTNDEDINDSVINKNYKTSDDKTGAKSEVDDNKSDEMLDDDHRKPSDDKHDDIGETSKVCESNDDNGKLVNTDCDSTVDKVPLNC